MRELLSQPNITHTADALVLKYSTASVLLWCCVPVVAAALGAAGLMFVRSHRQRANPPSPSAVPVTIVSIGAVVFAVVLSIGLIPAVFRTEIRVTSTEAMQDVGLWWDSGLRRFAYEDIAAIEITTLGNESDPEFLWKIVWRSGEIEAFNPGDLWSANQRLIRERMKQHGVRFADLDDSQ